MWIARYLLVLSVVVAVAVGAAVDIAELLERDQIIEAVNNAHTTWKAGRNFHPSLTKKYVRNLLGLKKRPDGRRLPVLEGDGDDSVELPVTFDARKQWPACGALQTVRDQGPCGSCWAVAAAAAFTDRMCIASKGKFNSQLSAEDLVSCCTNCGEGCNGGWPDKAWDYFQNTGIVTGGDYHSHQGCQPYTLPTCEHHVPGKRKDCKSYGDLPTPSCKTKCYNKNYTIPFKKDLHNVSSVFSVNTVKLIQKELFKNGPLEAGFEVYEDFLSYKSGVYQHTTGEDLGGHAVKLIGWGVEDKTPYWLVANSWNNDWGDNGYFKIKRGNDECGFEENVCGGYPVV